MLEWNQFINADAFDIMPQIEESSADLIFTSIPDLDDLGMSIKDKSKYETIVINIVNEFNRLIKDTGFVAMCQTDRKINASVYAKHVFIINIMETMGFILKDYKIIVVNQLESKNLYRFPYFHLCIFTRKGTIQRKGEWLKHIFQYDMKKQFHGDYCIWNENFVKLVIENLSKENDKVLDPFSGSGIVPYTSRLLNRQYLGFEISKEVYNNSIIKNAII